MGNPFADLKKLEMEIFSKPRVSKVSIERLRTLAKKCRRGNPDAEECICYHGALALIHEADGSLTKAIRHREEEIAKIHRLHELELENPTGGYALQNYGKRDLKDRERRLKALHARKKP
jgi:hypothetical protein